MSFLRHEEIYRSDMILAARASRGWEAASRGPASKPQQRTRRKERALLIGTDEFPAGYSLAGCSPAEPASASPTDSSVSWKFTAGNSSSANGRLSLNSVSQAWGALQGEENFSGNVPSVPGFPPRLSPVFPHVCPRFSPMRSYSDCD
jgi:hypothetical protein